MDHKIVDDEHNDKVVELDAFKMQKAHAIDPQQLRAQSGTALTFAQPPYSRKDLILSRGDDLPPFEDNIDHFYKDMARFHDLTIQALALPDQQRAVRFLMEKAREFYDAYFYTASMFCLLTLDDHGSPHHAYDLKTYAWDYRKKIGIYTPVTRSIQEWDHTNPRSIVHHIALPENRQKLFIFNYASISDHCHFFYIDDTDVGKSDERYKNIDLSFIYKESILMDEHYIEGKDEVELETITLYPLWIHDRLIGMLSVGVECSVAFTRQDQWDMLPHTLVPYIKQFYEIFTASLAQVLDSFPDIEGA